MDDLVYNMAEDYCILHYLDRSPNCSTALVHSASTPSLLVVRTFQIASLPTHTQSDILKDAQSLQHLHHPYLLTLYKVHKTQQGQLCFVTQYAARGSLHCRLANLKRNLMPEDTLGFLFAQICLGLKYLHEMGRICMDLTPKRVFFTSDFGVKINYYGNYKEKIVQFTRCMRNSSVSIGHLSPEVIEGSPYSFQSDIWALGALLYEMCELRPPFKGTSLATTGQLIVNGSYPPISPCYSQSLRTLVAQLLSKDPSQRPSIQTVLSNTLIQGYMQNLRCLAVQDENQSKAGHIKAIQKPLAAKNAKKCLLL